MCYFKKFIIIFLSVLGLIWIYCDKDSSPLNENVDNTDFVAKEPFSFEFPVSNHTQLRFDGINGNVLIKGKPGINFIRVTGEKRVGSESMIDAEEHLQELEVKVQDLSNEVFTETIQPEET